jgi:hypothetical protein
VAIGKTPISVEDLPPWIPVYLDYPFTSSMLVGGTLYKDKFPGRYLACHHLKYFIYEIQAKLLTVMSDFDLSPTSYKQKETVQNEIDSLQPTASCGEARIGEVEESRNGQFHRSFSPRQVHVRILWRVLDSPSV